VVFPIGADGKLGDATANVRDDGKLGPKKERQEAPHAHWIETSPDNRFALVADWAWMKCWSTSSMPRPAYSPRMNPRSRNLKLDLDAARRVLSEWEFVFAVNELSSTATSFAYDVKKGALKEIGTASTLPPGFSGRNDVAETTVHPNGKFLYVSNRGNDSIAIFSIDLGNRTLAPVGGFPRVARSHGILRSIRAANTCWRKTSFRTTSWFSRLMLRRVASPPPDKWSKCLRPWT